MIRCPACGGRTVGRVGASQYYCWDCCVEFSMTKRGFQIYRVDEDGTLVQAARASNEVDQEYRPEGVIE